MQDKSIFDMLDSTSNDTPVEQTILEKLEEDAKENPVNEIPETPIQNWSVPTVFEKDVVEKAVQEKKSNDDKKIKRWLKALLENEMAAYREKHGYEMNGQIKRATQRKIEKLYKKGKIKPMLDFASFN